MAKKQNKNSIIPLGGMNYDHNDKFIQEGDYAYMLNGIKYEVGEDGVIVNAPGNQRAESVATSFLVDNDGGFPIDDYSDTPITELDGDIPPGKIVGHCKDPKRNGIILFIRGGGGDWSGSVSTSMVNYSSIYEFFAAGEIYVPILKNSSVIDFEEDVVDATVIGDRLYWLERGQEPRTINLIKAYNYTHNGGDPSYDSITEEIVSLIKVPPLYDMDIEYGKDTSFDGSYIFDKMFQFRQQYVYEDSLKSSFGNTSKFVYNPTTFAENGGLVKDSSIDNFIAIPFNSGDEHVEKIRIAARETMDGDWFQIAVIDKDDPKNVYPDHTEGGELSSLNDSTTYYYRFYNTGGYDIIPREDIDKPYENIPIESHNMGAFENNRLIFGKNKIDYGDVDIGSSSCTPEYYDRPDHPYTIDVVWGNSTIGTDASDNDIIQSEYTYDLSNLPSTLKKGTIIYLRYAMKLQYDKGGTTYDFYAPDDGSGGGSDEILNNYVILDSDVSKSTFRSNLTSYIAFGSDKCYAEESGAQVSVTFTYDGSTADEATVKYQWYPGDSGRSNLNVVSRADDPNSSLIMAAYELYDSVEPSMKRGRSGQGAFQYIDKYGRRGEPQFSKATEFVVKEYADSTSKGYVGLQFSISHTPPIWAHYYQFLVSYQKLSFIQTVQMFAAPYLDYNGNSDGSIALFLGFPTQVLREAVQDEIDELEQRVSSLREVRNNLDQNKLKWSDALRITIPGMIYTAGQVAGVWGNKDNSGQQKRIDDEIERLERDIELKKYELSNQYKRALANVKRYHFSKNDRVRIIKAASGTTVYDSTGYVDDVLDFRVVDVLDSIDYSDDYGSTDPTTYEGLWLKVVPPNRDGFEVGDTNSVPSVWDNALIEIYKPSYDDSNKVFYEIPGIYEIYNPGTASRHHEDQGSTVSVRPNNCFYRIREMYTGQGPISSLQYKSKVVDWVEDPYLTHEFKSDNYSLGRPFISTDKEKGNTHPNLIYTNPHLEGTEINGLSQADFENIYYLSEEHGDIYGIKKRGNTLKVIQAKKITSFYPSNDSILGRMRHSQTDYGTVYPKSMVETPNGYFYGFDVYNGLVWRDTNNGVYNITGRSINRGNQSNYLMGNFFKKLAKDIRDNGIDFGSDDVIAAYDEQYDLIYFSFLQSNLDSNIIPYRTVMFHEPSNRWVGFLDIQPTGYAYGYNTLISSKGGDVWVHNREDFTRCNFYGEQKNFEIELVSNPIPTMRKVFDALHIHTTSDGFSVPEITVPEDRTNRNGQTSYLNNGHFKLEDGVYASPILNDITSTDGTERKNELYTGDKMRGYTLKLKLRSSDTDKFELFKVDVYYRPSMR